MGAEIITLNAIPLTPIHVGDGTELTPDSYVIRGNELLRFDPARVLVSLGESGRRDYLAMLNGGKLEGAQKVLGEAVTDADITGRIAVSDAAAQDLKPDAKRFGRIHPFVRSGGRPYIPGSSIKGALRTALLDHFARADVDPAVGARVNAVASVRNKHDALVSAAFNLRRDDTADDPLRFLSVADVPMPDGGIAGGATRVDRAIVIKRGRSGLERNEMQMHYERLLSASDGSVPRERELVITIALDSAGMRDTRRAGCPPGRSFDLATLREAVCRFHWNRWQSERKRFFAGEAKTCDAMDRLLRRVKIAGGTGTLAEHGPLPAPNYWLLRIGRFGHFESKSVDNLRQGHRPQDKLHPELPPGTEGLSRTVVSLDTERGEALVPFGWLLMFRRAAP